MPLGLFFSSPQSILLCMADQHFSQPNPFFSLNASKNYGFVNVNRKEIFPLEEQPDRCAALLLPVPSPQLPQRRCSRKPLSFFRRGHSWPRNRTAGEQPFHVIPVLSTSSMTNSLALTRVAPRSSLPHP